MTLPTKYQWLAQEGAPKMLVEALKLYGTIETPGEGNNPTILKWADEIGGTVEDVYRADSIPWCGLFAAVCVGSEFFYSLGRRVRIDLRYFSDFLASLHF